MLVDQGSSADVMFWSTFNKLQLSPDLLRPYTGCFYDFAGDQMEVRDYLELRTTFMDKVSGCERQFGVQHSAREASLEQIEGVSSTRHMKLKLSDLSGRVIVIKSD